MLLLFHEVRQRRGWGGLFSCLLLVIDSVPDRACRTELVNVSFARSVGLVHISGRKDCLHVGNHYKVLNETVSMLRSEL